MRLAFLLFWFGSISFCFLVHGAAYAQVFDTTYRYMDALESKAEAGGYYDVLAELSTLQKRFPHWTGANGTLARSFYLARNYTAAYSHYQSEFSSLQTPPVGHMLDALDCAYRLGEIEEAKTLLGKLQGRTEVKTNARLKARLPLWQEALVARVQQLDTLSIRYSMDTTFQFPNSGYVDFGAIPAGDNGQVLFASLRSDTVVYIGPTDPVFETTHIYRYTPGNNQADGFTRLELIRGLTAQGYQVGNPCLIDQGKVLFFSACKPTAGGSLVCKIFRAELDAKGRVVKSAPLDKQINKPGSSNTQPFAFATKNKGVGLYFASDRKGGRGGMDLYYATYDARKNAFSNPTSAGRLVNTPGNEGFPFYHTSKGVLFFSSDGHAGFGGLDVFEALGEGKAFDKISNLGMPINSMVDDHGYRPIDEEGKTGFLASNRQGALTVDKTNCCEDIFKWNKLDKPVKQEGALAARLRDEAAALAIRQANLKAEEDVILKARADAELAQKQEEEAQKALLAKQIPKPALIKKDTVVFRAKDLAKNESTAPIASLAPKIKRISQNIRFEIGSSTLLDESLPGLDTLATLLQQYPKWKITFTGHTDNKGSAVKNQKLGLSRAKAAATYLVNKGIQAQRLKTQSLGAKRPAFPNTTAENRARNRRVTARIVK